MATPEMSYLRLQIRKNSVKWHTLDPGASDEDCKTNEYDDSDGVEDEPEDSNVKEEPLGYFVENCTILRITNPPTEMSADSFKKADKPLRAKRKLCNVFSPLVDVRRRKPVYKARRFGRQTNPSLSHLPEDTNERFLEGYPEDQERRLSKGLLPRNRFPEHPDDRFRGHYSEDQERRFPEDPRGRFSEDQRGAFPKHAYDRFRGHYPEDQERRFPEDPRGRRFSNDQRGDFPEHAYDRFLGRYPKNQERRFPEDPRGRRFLKDQRGAFPEHPYDRRYLEDQERHFPEDPRDRFPRRVSQARQFAKPRHGFH